MGLVAKYRHRKHLRQSDPARKACTYRVFLVRAGELGWLGGEVGKTSGLTVKGVQQLKDLAGNLEATYPSASFSVFSIGGFTRQEFSAKIMAGTLGVHPEHLGKGTLTSDFKLGFGQVAHTLRSRAETGTTAFVIVAAEPTIEQFLGLPRYSVGEASAHHCDVHSPHRGAQPIITFP